MNQHEALCNINLRCAVNHADGICPGPYGKCNCGVEPNPSNTTMKLNHQGPCCGICRGKGGPTVRDFHCQNTLCPCHRTSPDHQEQPKAPHGVEVLHADHQRGKKRCVCGKEDGHIFGTPCNSTTDTTEKHTVRKIKEFNANEGIGVPPTDTGDVTDEELDGAIALLPKERSFLTRKK